MAFLMGLNESCAQVHTQLLLMEPEPTIQRAFSLDAQEVDQRSLLSLESPATINATVLMATSSGFNSSPRSLSNQLKKKERLVCTHCHLLGHTIDMRVHGHPGYR